MNARTDEGGKAYTFLVDTVADKDAFGSHERLANVMAQAMVKNTQLKVIGLLGPWGSGKSTVIGFLQRALLKRKSKPFLFNYDAWLHQNDPPRRSFLESFINFLVDAGLTKKETWTTRIDKLNGRIEDVLVTKTPQLTPSGRFILASLLLSPFGLSLLLKVSVAEALNPKSSDYWVAITGMSLVLAPALVAFIVYLCWRPNYNPFSKAFRSKQNWTTHRGEGKGEGDREAIFSLFLSRQVQRSKDRIVKDLEPTSIEFQEMFRELLQAVGDRARDIVIVIDNLDRLPETEAISLWSTIRSFFLGAHQIDNKGKARDKPATSRDDTQVPLPVVILPVDEKAIARLYDEAGNEHRGDAFMEKTFDVTFRVNRPVFTGWKQYVQTQMLKVFEHDLGKNWAYLTSRFIERAQVEKGALPLTPRHVNSLINRIASQWMLARDQGISFATVAYYCVFQHAVDENIDDATQKPKVQLDMFDEQWQRHLAALHFGVLPAEADEVLLDTPIRQAIEQETLGSFQRLSTVTGFAEQMVRICTAMHDDEAPEAKQVFSSIRLLGQSNIGASDELNEAWRRLRRALLKSGAWTEFGDREEEAISYLRGHGSAQDNAELLVFATIRAGGINGESGLDSAEALAYLWRNAVEAQPSVLDTVDAIPINAAANSVLDFVASLRKQPEIIARIRTARADTELEAALVKDLADPDDANAHGRLLGFTALRPDAPLSAYIAAASTAIGSGNQGDFGRGLDGLVTLRHRPDALAQLLEQVESGRIAAVCTESLRLGAMPAVATKALAVLMVHRPQLVPLPAQGWEKLIAGGSLIDLLGNALVEVADPSASSFTALMAMRTANANLTPIVRDLMTRALNAEAPLDLTADALLASFDDYRAALGEDGFRVLLDRQARDSEFWRSLRSQPLSTVLWPVVSSLHKLEGDVSAKAIEVLHEALLTVTAAQWAPSLAGPTDLSEAASFYRKVTGETPALPALFDPLVGGLDAALLAIQTGVRTAWPALVDFLPVAHQKTMLKNVRDAVLYRIGTPRLPILQQWDDALLNDGDFREKADDVCRVLLPDLLGTPEGRGFVAAQAPAFATCLGASGDDTRRVIIAQLATIKAEAATTESIDALASALNLLLPKPEEDASNAPSLEDVS